MGSEARPPWGVPPGEPEDPREPAPPSYPPPPSPPGWPQGSYPPPPGGCSPQSYGGPPAPGWYAPPPRTNGLAVAALVVGVLWRFWIGSVLALIFGYVAKGQIDRSRGAEGGRGLAVAGIVLGYVGIGCFLLFFLLGGVSASSGTSSQYLGHLRALV